MKLRKLPALTDDERFLLRVLADDPLWKDLPNAARGRFQLYGLITETPHGWIVTQAGKDALERAARAEEEAATPVRRTVRSPITGKRLPNRRNSPFD